MKVGRTKGGATNLKVGGVNALEGIRGQYSEKTKIWKKWGVYDPPRSCTPFYGGSAPGKN